MVVLTSNIGSRLIASSGAGLGARAFADRRRQAEDEEEEEDAAARAQEQVGVVVIHGGNWVNMGKGTTVRYLVQHCQQKVIRCCWSYAWMHLLRPALLLVQEILIGSSTRCMTQGLQD